MGGELEGGRVLSTAGLPTFGGAINIFFHSSIGTELLFFIEHMATQSEHYVAQPPMQLNSAK